MMQAHSMFNPNLRSVRTGPGAFFNRAARVRSGMALGALWDRDSGYSADTPPVMPPSVGTPYYLAAGGSADTAVQTNPVAANGAPAFQIDQNLVNSLIGGATAGFNAFMQAFGAKGVANSQQAYTPPPPEPFYKQTWFVVLGGIAAVGTAAYFITK